jgi:thioredoxin
MIELTAQQVEEKMASNENFILDCYAIWCGPCKVMMPMLESASSQISGLNIYKYNVDSDMTLTSKLGVRGVPTIKGFKDGKEVFNKVGLMQTNEIINLSNQLING